MKNKFANKKNQIVLLIFEISKLRNIDHSTFGCSKCYEIRACKNKSIPGSPKLLNTISRKIRF